MQIIEELNRLTDELGLSGIDVIKHGGAAMNAMWVIENSPALYFKFPKESDGGGSLWDYSATAVIFKEMGLFELESISHFKLTELGKRLLGLKSTFEQATQLYLSL